MRRPKYLEKLTQTIFVLTAAADIWDILAKSQLKWESDDDEKPDETSALLRAR